MSCSTGQFLVRLLEAYGVDIVFGIPGVHTVELYRGLAESRIRHVTPRHEQGAGFMADGYARASGKPGVAFVISGPGMTNIMTAMAQAYGDSVPMLVISAVNAHGRMGSGEGWLHELPDQRGLVSGVSAFNRTVHRPEELATAIAQAFAIFDGARPRPVHIELPLNVMRASAAHLAVPAVTARTCRPAPSEAELDAAAALLATAGRPVILAGGGAKAAAGAVADLADVLDAPVVMTTNARGILPPGHRLGVHLSASMPATRSLIAGADVVLALGTEFGSTDYDMYEDGGFTLPGRLVRVDIDPQQALRGPSPTFALIGDAGAAAKGLLARLNRRIVPDGAARAAAANAGIGALDTALRGDIVMLDIIRSALPDALIVGDSTQLVYAGNLAFAAATPGSYFNSATGFGTLGYALPAAVGAHFGSGRPVVALAGDGGLQFTIGELASAAEAKAPIVLLLHDNSGYGEIKSYMVSKGVAPLGVDLLTPDFVAVARACGWTARRLDRLSDLAPALADAVARDGPTMLLFGDELRHQAQSTE